MKSKGFTLIELLITMAIMVIVVALTIPIYKSTVSGISAVTASEESKIDQLLALETIRLDLQHVGTGIGLNETTPPIFYNETDLSLPVLDLRSTLINTNQTTLGWALITCTITTPPPNPILNGNYIVDQRENTSNNNLVLLDSSKNYIINNSCPDDTTLKDPNFPAGDKYVLGTNALFTAFPISNGTNACATGFCTNIRYNLSAAQPLDTCATGTSNLSRTVGGAIAGDTLVNCVAGLRVRFDIDANTDGRIVAGEMNKSFLPGTSADIMAQVRNIDMYLLVQVGNEDRSLRTEKTYTIDNISFNLEGIITNYQWYRWKIYKVSGKPNGWL